MKNLKFPLIFLSFFFWPQIFCGELTSEQREQLHKELGQLDDDLQTLHLQENTQIKKAEIIEDQVSLKQSARQLPSVQKSEDQQLDDIDLNLLEKNISNNEKR